jgi:hypothetical protein
MIQTHKAHHCVCLYKISYIHTPWLWKEVAVATALFAEKEQNHFGPSPMQRADAHTASVFIVLTGGGIEIRISHSPLLFYFRLVSVCVCAVCLPWRLACVLHRPINQSAGLHVVGKCLISALIFCRRSCLRCSFHFQSRDPQLNSAAIRSRPTQSDGFALHFGEKPLLMWPTLVAFCPASISNNYQNTFVFASRCCGWHTGPFNCSIMFGIFITMKSLSWSYFFIIF